MLLSNGNGKLSTFENFVTGVQGGTITGAAIAHSRLPKPYRALLAGAIAEGLIGVTGLLTTQAASLIGVSNGYANWAGLVIEHDLAHGSNLVGEVASGQRSLAQAAAMVRAIKAAAEEPFFDSYSNEEFVEVLVREMGADKVFDCLCAAL
jgi:hypothetical protein